jgi:hypothetical protein
MYSSEKNLSIKILEIIMGQFIIKSKNLTKFLKRLESIERYYENNESLIYGIIN